MKKVRSFRAKDTMLTQKRILILQFQCQILKKKNQIARVKDDN